jgi:hypothetical protein
MDLQAWFPQFPQMHEELQKLKTGSDLLPEGKPYTDEYIMDTV